MLFPPGTARHLVKPDDYPGVDREALSWFHGVLPQLIVKHPEVAKTRIDFVQRRQPMITISNAFPSTMYSLVEGCLSDRDCRTWGDGVRTR